MLPDPAVIELTESRVREIAGEENARLFADMEARLMSSMRVSVNEALKTVPTEDVVRQMIDRRVADARTELQASINSVDLHLRQAEGRVSESGRRMDHATDKFETFITEFREMFARLNANVEVNTGDIAAINRDANAQRKQAEIDRNEMTQTIDRLNDLKSDVHGDPTKPEMPSLFRMIALTNDSVNKLNSRLVRYDNLYNLGVRIWSTKLGKAVTISLLTAFTTDAVYQATKIIQAVLSGRSYP